jgi:hypothetical protein
VDPRSGVDEIEKLEFITLPGLELQALGGLACSQRCEIKRRNKFRDTNELRGSIWCPY